MKPNWVAAADKPPTAPIGLGRVARFKMTDLFFAQALGLPEGTRILDVNFPRADGGHVIHVLVQHDDLKVCEDTILDASPEFTKDAAGQVQFVGWGQK